VGTPSNEQRRAWDTVLAAQNAALDAIRPGGACAEVDAAARGVIEAAGYGADYDQFTHRLGHGIGLQVHEEPYLVRGNQLALAPGMTFSNEPGIYVPGSLGVRLEDIVAVTAEGPEVFGPRPTSLDDPFGEA
jgi:Xaa-Pro dipeptidase